MNIELPEPKIDIENETFTYTDTQQIQILRIHYNYLVLSDVYPKLLTKLSYKDKEVDNLKKQKEICENSTETYKVENKFLYNLADEQYDRMKKEKNKNLIKTVLISGGVGLGALGIGILIGMFAK